MKWSTDEILKYLDETIKGLDPFTKILFWIFTGLGCLLIVIVHFFLVLALIGALLGWMIGSM
jgi:hypothetical protein